MKGQLRNTIMAAGREVRLPVPSEIRTLLEPPSETCVTIQFPTEMCGRDTLKGPISMRNLLKEAEAQILDFGRPRRTAEEILEPAWALLEDPLYWQHLARGLVLYLGEGVFHDFRVPYRIEERVIVSARFQLEPVLPLVLRHGLFYVLALSRKRTRLYQATPFLIGEVELDEKVPVSLYEEIAKDDFTEYVEQRSVRPAGAVGRPGPGGVIYHSHGGGLDSRHLERRLLDQLTHLDKGIQKAFVHPHAPLVLAGVDDLRASFRRASSYPHLLEEGIEGNVERTRMEEIHRRAWAIVEPYLTRREQEDRERYLDSLGTGLASSEIDAILPAAARGRVGTLFVCRDHEAWGSFDPAADLVEVHDQRQKGDEELLNAAIAETLRNSGAVHVVPPERMPDGTFCAALLRY